MQTKFSTLLKLKKNELEMVERQVTIIQNKIQSCKEDLSNQNNVIDSLETPKEGSILLLKQFSSHMSILMDEKKRMEEKLLVLQNDYEQTMQIYKQANIEYEKRKQL
jgi:replicative DNA helicase